MKISIELTPEQILTIIKAETAVLLTAKEKAIKLAEKTYGDEVAKLEKKFKNFTIETGESGGKPVDDFKKSIAAISAKLWKVRKTNDVDEITRLENERNYLNEQKKLAKSK